MCVSWGKGGGWGTAEGQAQHTRTEIQSRSTSLVKTTWDQLFQSEHDPPRLEFDL